MRERAESVGGTLRIDATPGRGTLVRAVLPAVVG
jgi:signal transduction histidine kinase